MKKIVGIAVAAAMLASSIFAADVAAKVALGGSLFNYDSSTNKVGMFSVAHKAENWNPDLSFSVTGDNAGASFKMYSADFGTSGLLTGVTDSSYWRMSNTFLEAAMAYQIWLKPVDVLKITVGQIGTNLNQEQIDYGNSKTGLDSYGYGLGINTNGFALDVFLAPGWSTASNTNNYWLNIGSDATVAETYAIAKYSADFGTIGAYLDAKETFKYMEFGAGFAGSADAISYFVQAIGYVNATEDGKYAANKGFSLASLEAFAKGSVNAFSWAVFAKPTINIYQFSNSSATINDQLDVFATAKVSYALDGVTPFLYVKVADCVTNSFAINVKPGINGSVGAAWWEIGVDMNFGTTTTIDVPLSLSVSF